MCFKLTCVEIDATDSSFVYVNKFIRRIRDEPLIPHVKVLFMVHGTGY